MFSGTSSCCLKSVFFLIKTFWHRPQLALECCSGLQPWLRSRGKGPHPLGPTTLSPSFQAAQAFSGNVLPSHHQPQVLQKNDHSLWLPCCRGGSKLHLLTPGPAQIDLDVILESSFCFPAHPEPIVSVFLACTGKTFPSNWSRHCFPQPRLSSPFT